MEEEPLSQKDAPKGDKSISNLRGVSDDSKTSIQAPQLKSNLRTELSPLERRRQAKKGKEHRRKPISSFNRSGAQAKNAEVVKKSSSSSRTEPHKSKKEFQSFTKLKGELDEITKPLKKTVANNVQKKGILKKNLPPSMQKRETNQGKLNYSYLAAIINKPLGEIDSALGTPINDFIQETE
jgi:hypothetical protein